MENVVFSDYQLSSVNDVFKNLLLNLSLLHDFIK